MGPKKKARRLNSSFVKSTFAVGSGSGLPSLNTSKMSLTRIRQHREAVENTRVQQLRALTAGASQSYEHTDSDEPMGWEGDDFGDMAEADVGHSVEDLDVEESQETRLEVGRDGPAFHHAIRDIFDRPRRRHDQRTRLQRNKAMHASWEVQITDLVTAYLEWRYGSPVPGGGESIRGGDSLSSDPLEVREAEAGDTSEPHLFEVTAIDIKNRVEYQQIKQYPNERPNVALVRAGFLGCSPLVPSVAISLECLELYHQIRCRQSSFSLQAMAKVLCALHNVSYFPTFRTQLSIAFDMYLDILRRVQVLVDHALGRNEPNWRLLHACPPCGYKLEDEPKLTPERLHAMDGNNSLKRVDGAGHSDDHTFVSDYIIPPSEVDRFKDDVVTRPGTTNTALSNATTSTNEAPPHGSDETVCTDNWVAANASSKETLQLYEQTGVFVAVCRHGLLETLVEMRRSGELAKYGLATLEKIIDTYGDDQAMGYDIACSHMTTVAASSLGDKARTRRLLLAVNAFHGYAHNLLCQLRNHPLYVPGVGIEDFETCERVFSASNAVARVIRYSSHFHYRQFIDLHFRQWDQDKYLDLSKFLYNNYKQALGIIAEYVPEIEHFKAVHSLDDMDFVRWHNEQLEYLTNLKNEPPQDLLKVEYVEALEALEKAEAAYGSVTTVQFQEYTPADFAGTGSIPAATEAQHRARETARRAALRKLKLAMNVADDLERRLGLEDRWTPEDNEYREAAAYIKRRRFIRVVEELERLVVQRLFELAKANLNETAYRMRKHIGNAISRRSAAVHNAVDKYNAMALLQDPPRPILEYADVAAYSWLGDFELLKESRHDVLQKPWANPANREVSTKYYKVLRAREEIIRLNVEIRRLHTWVNDEDAHMVRSADNLAVTNPVLARAVRQQYAHQSRVNRVHRLRIRMIHSLPNYSGHTNPGVQRSLVSGSRGIEVNAGTSEGGEEVIPGDPEVNNEVRSDLQGDQSLEVDEDGSLRDDALRYSDALEKMTFTWQL